jgi:GNAT superfamily N-acetyltransferase
VTRLVPIDDLGRLLPDGASARLYNANGRPLPILLRRAQGAWLAEAPIEELRLWCRENRCPERLMALRCEAIAAIARGPREAAEALWRVLGMLEIALLPPAAAAVHPSTPARAGAWREE